MAKLKNPLLSLRASGSLGQLLSFCRRKNANIVEKKPVPVDAATSAQLYHRNMFGLCVDLWHTLSDAEKAVWESAGTVRHMTGYAWYLSQCLRPNPGIYLPLAGGAMSGEIDMDSNLITDLPAPAADNDAARKTYVDALISIHGEGHITILPQSYSAIIQGAWVWLSQANQWGGFCWRNSFNADGDEIHYAAYLAKGTYTVGLFCLTASANPILDIYIDGDEVASFDLYTAGPAPNSWFTQTSISVSVSGLKTIKLKVDGKNGSSSGHNVYLSYFVFWRPP